MRCPAWLTIVPLAAALVACKDNEAGGFIASASAPPVPASFAGPPVPPPPRLDELVAQPGPAASAPTPSAADGAEPPASSAAGNAFATAHDQLQAAIAKASSCSADAQCRSLAVGGKACGGPTGYQAYNPSLPGADQIPGLAQREHDLALQAARESHRVSNCMMMRDPGAKCLAGQCVTGGPVPAPAHQ